MEFKIDYIPITRLANYSQCRKIMMNTKSQTNKLNLCIQPSAISKTIAFVTKIKLYSVVINRTATRTYF